MGQGTHVILVLLNTNLSYNQSNITITPVSGRDNFALVGILPPKMFTFKVSINCQLKIDYIELGCCKLDASLKFMHKLAIVRFLYNILYLTYNSIR